MAPFFSGGLAGAADSVAAGVLAVLEMSVPNCYKRSNVAIARLTGKKMIREKGQGYSSLLQTVGLQRQTNNVRTSQKSAVQ